RKMYLKALTLHSLEEIDDIKNEIKCGNILIVRIEPLVRKSVEDAKRAVNELSEFAASIGGDIARLGEERIILTPPSVQIWKEKFSETASK
ncbi:cell division protein SepF, partial [Candidatus Bathyarchaeota archaeon]|nr:cell division protein SepF [Candidatus Bathyarchaeota archaeon]